MISVRSMTVQFGGLRALDDLTFDLDGDITGVIGPNGAGKTTLLNVLSGFVTPRSGTVEVDGVGLLPVPVAKRARWGLRRTFQAEMVVGELPVRDNVLVAAENCGRHAHRAVHDVLGHLGLTPVEHVAAGRLDGFRRRLVEIARAAVGSPRLILMDEPGAGLAHHESERLGQVIRGLPAVTGARVLVIDHDVDLIATTCEQTACLDFGRLVAVGPTRAVLDDRHVRSAYLGVDDRVTDDRVTDDPPTDGEVAG